MGKGARDGHYAQESEASELNGASVKGGLMGREEGKQGNFILERICHMVNPSFIQYLFSSCI